MLQANYFFAFEILEKQKRNQAICQRSANCPDSYSHCNKIKGDHCNYWKKKRMPPFAVSGECKGRTHYWVIVWKNSQKSISVAENKAAEIFQGLVHFSHTRINPLIVLISCGSLPIEFQKAKDFLKKHLPKLHLVFL